MLVTKPAEVNVEEEAKFVVGDEHIVSTIMKLVMNHPVGP